MVRRFNLRSSAAGTLLIALVVPLLAACGGSTEQGGAATTAPATSNATSAPAATTGAAAPAATTAPAATSAAGAATTVPAATSDTSAAATAAPAATAAATGTGQAGGTLRIVPGIYGTGAQYPDSLDPQDSSVANEIAIEQLNYEGLTRYDKDLKTVPGAAEKWESNQAGTEWTFHLRDNLKYSDGSPLGAQDFVNAIRRSLDPRGTVGDYQSTFFMIKGADAIINTAIPTDEAKVDASFNDLAATAPDAKTIKFTLTQPTPYFPTLVGLWVAYPAKDDLVKKGGDTWWQDPKNQIGNGPFQVTTIDEGNNLIEMKANPNYWQGRPKLDGIQFKYIKDPTVALQAYKNNEVDIIGPDPNDYAGLKADPVLGKEFKQYAGSCTESYELNNTLPPFDDKNVRQAFSMGFDRDAYIRDALKNSSVKTLTWIPPGYPGYNAALGKEYDYNPDKAKQLIAQSKYANNMPEIKISYNSNQSSNQARVEYLIQMYQKSLGITLVPDPIEAKTLNGLRKDVSTHPQINGGGWCADYPDQQDWLSIFWQSRSGFAKSIGYKNADADKLMDQADIELDATKRAALYDQAQKLIIDDMGYIIRSNSVNSVLIKPNVSGFDFTPQDGDLPGQVTGLLNVTISK